MDVTAPIAKAQELRTEQSREGHPNKKTHLGFDLFLNLSQMVSPKTSQAHDGEYERVRRDREDASMNEARQVQERNRRELEQRRADKQEAADLRNDETIRRRRAEKEQKARAAAEQRLKVQKSASTARFDAKSVQDMERREIDQQRDRASADKADAAKALRDADDSRAAARHEINRDAQQAHGSSSKEIDAKSAAHGEVIEDGEEISNKGLKAGMNVVEDESLSMLLSGMTNTVVEQPTGVVENEKAEKAQIHPASATLQRQHSADDGQWDGAPQSDDAPHVGESSMKPDDGLLKNGDEVLEQLKLNKQQRLQLTRHSGTSELELEQYNEESIEALRTQTESTKAMTKPRHSADVFAQQNRDLNADAVLQRRKDSGSQSDSGSERASEKWSKLLRQNGLFEKLKGSARKVFGDSVQLSSGATKSSGADAAVARLAGTPLLPMGLKVGSASQAQATAQSQHTAGSNLPEGVDEMSILRQISDGLRLGKGRNQTAQIKLHPSELGTVQVRIEMQGASARILVSAESAAVGDVLSNGLEQLRRDMLAQGVQVTHVEVRSELDSHDDQNEQQQSGGEGGEAHESADEEKKGRSSFKRSDGRIHVRA